MCRWRSRRPLGAAETAWSGGLPSVGVWEGAPATPRPLLTPGADRPMPQAPKKVAAGLAAAFAAVTLVLAPAANAADARPAPKSVVCASNPTAKVW